MKTLTLAASVILIIGLSAFTKVNMPSTTKSTILPDQASPVHADFIAPSPMGPKANLSQADIN